MSRPQASGAATPLLCSGTQQTGLQQCLLDGLIHLVVTGIRDRITGDENQILTWRDRGPSSPSGLSQESLGSVTNCSLANPLAYGETETTVIQLVGKGAKHQHSVGPGTTFLLDPLELLIVRQTVSPLHDPDTACTRSTFKESDGQSLAALLAARLEHSPTTRSTHSGPESVTSLTLPFLGLVRTLGHDEPLE